MQDQCCQTCREARGGQTHDCVMSWFNEIDLQRASLNAALCRSMSFTSIKWCGSVRTDNHWVLMYFQSVPLSIWALCSWGQLNATQSCWYCLFWYVRQRWKLSSIFDAEFNKSELWINTGCRYCYYCSCDELPGSDFQTPSLSHWCVDLLWFPPAAPQNVVKHIVWNKSFSAENIFRLCAGSIKNIMAFKKAITASINTAVTTMTKTVLHQWVKMTTERWNVSSLGMPLTHSMAENKHCVNSPFRIYQHNLAATHLEAFQQATRAPYPL